MKKEQEAKKQKILDYLSGWLLAAILVIIVGITEYYIETPLDYCQYPYCIKISSN